MPGHDEHDLERRLREQRVEASSDFVQSLAADVQGRSHPSARPRLTLALALSLALVTSMVAFGGVGAASSAWHSAVRGHFNDGRGHGHGHGHGHKPPSHDQYHGKVKVCYPHKSYVITYVDKTVYRKHVTWKVVWKRGKHGHHGHWKHVKIVTWEPVVK